MSAIILTRRSDYQNYCTNYLAKRGILTHAVFEAGRSSPSESHINLAALLKNAKRYIQEPAALSRRFHQYVNLHRYYGDEHRQNARILGSEKIELVPDLASTEVMHINSHDAFIAVSEQKPSLAFVLGTNIVSQRILDALGCPAVNLHFGWSPEYRGEGIVTALALEGPRALGVTVHFCNAVSDGGDILHRARIEADASDNFYSLALKCAVAGTTLLEKVYRDHEAGRLLTTEKQDVTKSRLFGRTYMNAHPGIYKQAWKNLKANV